jgi:hypothetical protein
MSEVSRCFSCGAFLQKDDRFCWACGRDLVLPGPAQTAPPPDLEDDLSREDWLTLRRAYLMQSRGNLEEAERLVSEVLADRPDHVPSLTLLAEVQRARGDRVGAVESARRAAEVAATAGQAPPGALKRAREERAQIEESVIREVTAPEGQAESSPLSAFVAADHAWYRRGGFLILLALLGAGSLFLALVAALRGSVPAYLWIAGGMLAAGWTYQDAESSQRTGLFWGPLVLFLGPFGLAIYLLSRR